MIGLRYKPWGETDLMLTSARKLLKALLCGCGCGQYADESHDPNSRYEVDTSICKAGEALEQHRELNEKPPAGQTVSVRLVSLGRTDPTDPLGEADYAAVLKLLHPD